METASQSELHSLRQRVAELEEKLRLGDADRFASVDQTDVLADFTEPFLVLDANWRIRGAAIR